MNSSFIPQKEYPSLAKTIGLIVVGILANLVPSQIVLHFNIPLFFDCIGTILATMIGGIIPGVIVGFFSNIINGISDPITVYYSVTSVLIAFVTMVFFQRGHFASLRYIIYTILGTALIGGGIGSVLTYLLYGFNFGEGISAPFAYALSNSGIPIFPAQFIADMIIDLIDKSLVVTICVFVYRRLPQRFLSSFRPPSVLELDSGSTSLREFFHHSLLRKIICVLAAFEIILCMIVFVICFVFYRNIILSNTEDRARSAAELVATTVDANMIETYLKEGTSAPGYTETSARLTNIMNSFENLEYLYVYHFEKDGIHVVFDIDSYDEQGNLVTEGDEPGYVFDYDESFEDLVPSLLAGRDIDPVITNDTYGWLLTIYVPIHDDAGIVQAYACADISMYRLTSLESEFLARVLSMLVGASLIILTFVLYFAELHIVFPINSMEDAALRFAYGSTTEQKESLECLDDLNIDTGDELTHLYNALKKMAVDSIHYIDEIKENAATLNKLQESIILDFANMVEARDKCTGDHIARTSHYVDLITQEMLREGDYPDKMTAELAKNMVRSAPLHDVGKIKISDTLLNKPGRLSDEEFELMKTHTTEGKKILEGAILSTADTGYLREAIDMAWCHHERWDGKGYPRGIAGEEIPVSARVMAVADVFDALVSRRSYKEPYPFDKAVEIIREESGTHFDPVVANAFLAIAETLRADIEASQAADAHDTSEK